MKNNMFSNCRHTTAYSSLFAIRARSNARDDAFNTNGNRNVSHTIRGSSFKHKYCKAATIMKHAESNLNGITYNM